MPLPEPVDGHAREQGVLGVQHPFHELLAAAGRKALSCAGAGRHVEPCVGDVKHAADFFLGAFRISGVQDKALLLGKLLVFTDGPEILQVGRSCQNL